MFCSKAFCECNIINLLSVTNHRSFAFSDATIACLLEFSHRHPTAAEANSVVGPGAELNSL